MCIDKVKDDEYVHVFKDMTAAYDVLKDPTRRSEYDQELESSLNHNY